MIDAWRLAAVVVVAGLGSMVNSIAGGGTLLTFPSLIALGVSPIVANATSTVALWPGAVGSMYGYRHRMAGMGRWAAGFAVPSVLGGGVGAWLLLVTPPDRFSRIVPWLVLGATLLFAVQGPIVRWTRGRTNTSDPVMRTRDREATSDRENASGTVPVKTTPDPFSGPRHSAAALACQFLVGVYGGYFGAGIGIMMLAVLGFLGFTDIHQMNGLKNWGGACINFVAAVVFAVSGLVDWAVALAMAAGATAGGYLASRLAQKVRPELVRRAIVGIGLAAGLWMLFGGLS